MLRKWKSITVYSAHTTKWVKASEFQIYCLMEKKFDDKNYFGFTEVSAKDRTFLQKTTYQTDLSQTHHEDRFLIGRLCYL